MAASKPTNIDYVKNYFQIPKLTPIHGEPSFNTLRILRDELKANAGSIPTTLGGGLLGYLGVLFSTPDYLRVAPDTPFIRPQNPGPLMVPAGTAQYATTRMREDHAEALRLHRECIDVEQALIKLALEAIETKYTKCLRNRVTQRVDMTLEVLLQTLFQRYGFVTQHQLIDFETSVRQYQYDITDPLSLVFDLVEDLQLMAEAAGTPNSESQLVAFGVEILRSTHDFQDGIKSWNRRSAADKTWANYITHFEQEYKELLQLRGPSMQNSNLHSANAIVAKVKASVEQSVEASMQKAFTRHSANALRIEKHFNTPPAGIMPPELANLPPSYSIQEIHPPSETPSVAFSSFSSSTYNSSDMQNFMKMFMEKMDKRMQRQEEVLRNLSNNRGRPNKLTDNDGGGSYRKRRNISKYCWSHGACAHTSRDCNNKRSGHKDNASFSNKLGGSTRFCE